MGLLWQVKCTSTLGGNPSARLRGDFPELFPRDTERGPFAGNRVQRFPGNEMREGGTIRENPGSLRGDVTEDASDDEKVEGNAGLIRDKPGDATAGLFPAGGRHRVRLPARGHVGSACGLDLPGFVSFRPRFLQAGGGITVAVAAVLLALCLLRHEIPLSRE